jgi:hypothetical protein
MTIVENLWHRRNRMPVLMASVGMVVVIALVDWWTPPYVSLGFLYLFPIILAAGFLPRAMLVLVAIICAGVSEAAKQSQEHRPSRRTQLIEPLRSPNLAARAGKAAMYAPSVKATVLITMLIFVAYVEASLCELSEMNAGPNRWRPRQWRLSRTVKTPNQYLSSAFQKHPGVRRAIA